MPKSKLALLSTLLVSISSGQLPVINEFMASNDDALILPDGSSPDWIEIHNPGASPINLAGWHLTDNAQNPTRWTFPAGVTLAANGYLLVYATGDNLLDPAGDLHTDFQLEQSGEYLALVDPSGMVQQEFAPEYPEQFEDFSYGLPTAGGNPAYFFAPSPGAENNQPVQGLVEDTKFSADRGFFDDPFEVTITSNTPGASIYYTLDGSDPSLGSTRVDAPDELTPPSATVTISTTTVLRAFAGKEGYLPTDIDSQTYLFLDQVIAHPQMSTAVTEDPDWGPQMREALLDIPTISLITQEEIPLDQPTVNSPREIPLSIEMIYPDGRRGFQANAGVERFGGVFSTFDGNKKALRISFKEVYGPKRLRHNLFEGTKYGAENAVESFDQFLLRNGSHDSIFYEGPYTRPRNGAFVRNRYFLDRQFEMGHPSLRGRFVHVYLNGVYNGHYHLMERPTADHMAEYFGGDEDDYDVVRGRSGLEYQNGSLDAWNTLVNNAGNWEMVQDLVDVDNYIDYMLLNFYGGNDHDWYPNHNWVAVKRRDETGRFRFFMWDSDFLMRSRLPDGGNTVDNGGPSNILRLLKTIPEFRLRMADRAQKHFYGDGLLTAESVNEDYNTFGEELARSIIPETARWGNQSSPFYTPDTFQAAISWLANDYPSGNLRPRVETVIQQMREDNLFPDLNAPILSQYSGQITPGTVVGINHDQGNLFYTTDGSDPRLPDGSVNPNAVSVGGTLFPITVLELGSDWKYDDTKIQPPTDWFAPDFDDSGWSTGPSPLATGGLTAAPTATTVFVGTPRGLTFYARKTFNLTDAAGFLASSLNMIYDDGFAIYLNGQEIIRENLPDGPLTIDTAALNNGEEIEYQNFTFDPALLVEGENVIAIEIHNRTVRNIDLGFDLELIGETSNPNRFVTLDDTTVIRTRALLDDEWSALTEATFITDVPAAAGNLVISEIHYNPSEEQGNEAEFIELTNVSNQRISLNGVRFTQGISFAFEDQASLDPGARVLLVYNQTAFEAAYGTDPRIGGIYLSRLSNGGEGLTLTAADGSTIEFLTYSDAAPWPAIADGVGYSLVRISPGAAADSSLPQNWRSSIAPGGTPGSTDSFPYDPAGTQSLMEYATGSESGGLLEFVGDEAIFEHRQVHGADDAFVEVQVSSDLVNWSSSGITFLEQNNMANDTAMMRWLIPNPDGNRVFTRIRVTLNP